MDTTWIALGWRSHTMIRVLLADDHTLFREGVRRLLDPDSEIEVVAEAARGVEAIERSVEMKPHVVLLDVSMPGRGGLETLRDLKDRQPGIRVLMLTVHPESRFAIRCIKAGADGYMTKDAAPEELVRAIRRLASGRKYITPELAEQLAMTLGQDFEGQPHELLSDREFQVMRMIASGMTVSEVANELTLSVKTISTYRARILDKMGLRNNAEIMHYAIPRGLAE